MTRRNLDAIREELERLADSVDVTLMVQVGGQYIDYLIA